MYPAIDLDERFDPVVAWHNPDPEFMRAPLDGLANVMEDRFFDPARFRAILERPENVRKRGGLLFSSDPSRLRKAKKIADGLHAEVNHSANGLRDVIRMLLALPFTSTVVLLSYEVCAHPYTRQRTAIGSPHRVLRRSSRRAG